MKVGHRLAQVHYISSNDKLTSFAGLKLLTDMAYRLGIVRDLEERVRVKKRRRGIPVADFVLSIAQTMIAGGSSLSDLSVLRGERGTRRLLYDLEIPATTTAGERLRTSSLGHIRQLESVNARALRRLVECAGLGGPITLDVDSSLFEVRGYLKEGVRYGYEGKKGFHPLLAFWAEERLLVGTRLRSGNRHPADGVLSSLSVARGRLPKDPRVRLRLDAGFYDQKIARYAEKHHLEFSIEEFKNGFGARQLPSRKFLANWAWLTIAQLAYTLVQAFKILVLPRKERAAQIKALRFQWFCVAARIIRSARRVTLALARALDVAAAFAQAQVLLHPAR